MEIILLLKQWAFYIYARCDFSPHVVTACNTTWCGVMTDIFVEANGRSSRRLDVMTEFAKCRAKRKTYLSG
jgi:hypothetical protein